MVLDVYYNKIFEIKWIIMVEEVKKVWIFVKLCFIRKWNEFVKVINNNKGIDFVKVIFVEFCDVWSMVEGKYDLYILFFMEEEVE